MSADGPTFANESPLARHMWHAAAFAEEVVDAPVQVWLAGEPWVLARLNGEPVAFVDRCPHRLAPLSAGRILTGDGDAGDRIACGYHGWRYDATGRCDHIPSLGRAGPISKRAKLRAAAGVREAYGLLWVAPEEPLAPLPAFPEWLDPSFVTARATVVRTPAGAGQVVDNFLDAAHFPFVHAETFGVEGQSFVAGDVGVEAGQVTATFTTPYRERDSVTEHTVRKTVGAALNVHLRLELAAAGGSPRTIAILLACVPEREGVTRVVKLIARDDIRPDDGSGADALAEFVKDEDRILAEDLTILERYPHRTVPLDPRAEVHTRADRLSLAWRSLLAEATAATPAGAAAATPW